MEFKGSKPALKSHSVPHLSYTIYNSLVSSLSCFLSLYHSVNYKGDAKTFGDTLDWVYFVAHLFPL